MPLLALATAAFVIGLEQLVQWQYGATGIIGLVLLTIGIKARNPEIVLLRIQAASQTASLASWMAGRRRAHLREEWAAILAGDPDNGILLSPPRRMCYALGFVWAAALMRLRDLTAPLGRLLDWALSVPSRTNSLLVAAVGFPAALIAGTCGLLTAGLCSVYCWIIGRATVWLLRRMRGIEPVSPRRASEKE
ncbi:hypothetical protein [Streptomyces sp. NPDC048419]|uniref:hypothetical protein n=1 Tax=Streptomyces sp. NPDC048419 TaxID=3365547 RepID=UPI00371C932B